MSENKTKATAASVERFLHSIVETQRGDCVALVSIIKQAVGLPPRMWGASVVGFGDFHFNYKSGRDGDTFLIGFSPQKKGITLYTVCGFNQFPELLKSLGKHKTGKGCLSIDSIDSIDAGVLKKLIKAVVDSIPKETERQ